MREKIKDFLVNLWYWFREYYCEVLITVVLVVVLVSCDTVRGNQFGIVNNDYSSVGCEIEVTNG